MVDSDRINKFYSFNFCFCVSISLFGSNDRGGSCQQSGATGWETISLSFRPYNFWPITLARFASRAWWTSPTQSSRTARPIVVCYIFRSIQRSLFWCFCLYRRGKKGGHNNKSCDVQCSWMYLDRAEGRPFEKKPTIMKVVGCFFLLWTTEMMDATSNGLPPAVSSLLDGL